MPIPLQKLEFIFQSSFKFWANLIRGWELASDVLHEMVGNVRKVDAGLIFPWRQHRLASGQEEQAAPWLVSLLLHAPPTITKTASISNPSIPPVHVEGGVEWPPSVPPITHVLCHRRKLEEKGYDFPRLGLSFLPWGSQWSAWHQLGTVRVWGMRGPPPTCRPSLVGTDKQVLINNLPRMCVTTNRHRGAGRLCRSSHAFYLIWISSNPNFS